MRGVSATLWIHRDKVVWFVCARLDTLSESANERCVSTSRNHLPHHWHAIAAGQVWLVAKSGVKKLESFEKYREYQLSKLAPVGK